MSIKKKLSSFGGKGSGRSREEVNRLLTNPQWNSKAVRTVWDW